MTAVVAPETEAREALVRLLETTYSEEAFRVRSDKLHPSLGDEGVVLGVYPDHTRHDSRNALTSEMNLVVQFYGSYQKQIDRNMVVDPAKVESYAERFRRALKSQPFSASPAVWYFMLEDLAFPLDPTGNITRFVAKLKARGNNTALAETH